MRFGNWFGRGAGASALTLALALGAAGPAANRTFESDGVGKPAVGFRTEVGRWEVVQDGANRVLAQLAENGDRVFNLALVEGASYQDVDVSIRVKPRSGRIDQGGGVVWRAKDKDNYYIARLNPLEDNLRVYKVEDGRRTQLDHADAPGKRDWRTIRITMRDREITGWLDGVKLLVAEDSTFPDAGRIGVWSKSDARTYFDDLTARAIP